MCYIYRQKKATRAVITRAPADPTETREDPLWGGAEVAAGALVVADAEVALAGALVDALALALALDTAALLLGAGAEADGAGAEGAEGADEPAVGVAEGAGALPGGVTWIWPSVYSLTGTYVLVALAVIEAQGVLPC